MCVDIGSVSHCGMVLVCGGTRKNTSTEVRTGRFQQRNLVSQGFLPQIHSTTMHGTPTAAIGPATLSSLSVRVAFVRRHAESVCRLWEWQRDPPHCCATMQLAGSPCLPPDACCLQLLVNRLSPSQTASQATLAHSGVVSDTAQS